jgi:mannose-6-phosphate isomerase-like protein (cupin superfamily)
LKVVLIVLLASTPVLVSSAAASKDVDIYSPGEVQSISQKLAARKSAFAAQELEKYGNHYTMVAFREQTGSAEVHEKEADVFIIVDGTATIVTGGKLVNAHTEKPGELRAASIDGGNRHPLEKGSIIHIPAGVPHQLLIKDGDPVTYFVVKVTDR